MAFKTLNETEKQKYIQELVTDSNAVAEVLVQLLRAGSDHIQSGGESKEKYIESITKQCMDVLTPVLQPLLEKGEITHPEILTVLWLLQMNVARTVILNGTKEVQIDKEVSDATGRENSTGTTQFVN